jgi:hypothetical protein
MSAVAEAVFGPPPPTKSLTHKIAMTENKSNAIASFLRLATLFAAAALCLSVIFCAVCFI